jgi:hypothetical protein
LRKYYPTVGAFPQERGSQQVEHGASLGEKDTYIRSNGASPLLIAPPTTPSPRSPMTIYVYINITMITISKESFLMLFNSDSMKREVLLVKVDETGIFKLAHMT